jgi:hypothetical protein
LSFSRDPREKSAPLLHLSTTLFTTTIITIDSNSIVNRNQHGVNLTSLIVIIPFFQRDSGVLTRTLQAIDAQSAFESIAEVVIVDDGSPISAASELESLSPRLRDKTTILKQTNAGVSSARNAGLAYVCSKSAAQSDWHSISIPTGYDQSNSQWQPDWYFDCRL